MKNCYLVTSLIEADNTFLLKKNQIRSILTTEDRFFDTIKTIDCIVENDSEAKIFLLDASKEYFEELIIKYPNLHYIHIEKTNPNLANNIRTHPSKSHGESLMILDFLKQYKNIIASEYDYLIKLSGRYYFVGNYLNDLNEKNINKFLFKKPVFWNKKDLTYLSEEYLPTEMYIGDKLGGYYTVINAIGNTQLNKYEIAMFACASMTDTYSKYFYVDIEYLLYKIFSDFEFKNNVIETNWTVEGRGGQNGKYFRF
jgi:hypothetical protein